MKNVYNIEKIHCLEGRGTREELEEKIKLKLEKKTKNNDTKQQSATVGVFFSSSIQFVY